jgi:hypothetical protein
MLGRLAWLKVIAENRGTIFKLVTEVVFGRKSRPRDPDLKIPYEEVTPEVSTEVGA